MQLWGTQVSHAGSSIISAQQSHFDRIRQNLSAAATSCLVLLNGPVSLTYNVRHANRCSGFIGGAIQVEGVDEMTQWRDQVLRLVLRLKAPRLSDVRQLLAAGRRLRMDDLDYDGKPRRGMEVGRSILCVLDVCLHTDRLAYSNLWRTRNADALDW